MTLGPLQILPPKPRMTLDAFREMSSKASSQKREMSQVIDAFQNAAARLGFGSTNLMEGTSYPFNRITLNYVLLTSLYRGNWIIRKIVDAIADDMTKNWLSLDTELPPEKIKRFDKEGIEATATVARLNKAIKLGRLYGGAVAVMVLKGDDDFEKPLVVDDIELGSYKGLLVFDRWSGVNPSLNIITDVDDPIGFGLPEFYQVTTETAKFFKVHHSRVLRFCGPDLPNWEWQANMRWGASVVEAMFEELKKRDNTSWNIASLVFRANIMEMPHKTLSAMLSGLGANQATAQQFYNTLSQITHLMSNQGLLITPEDSGGVRTHQYSFGGINDVYQSFMLDICGATEYPMSRLFGRTVTGLGQGNEGDEHSYYELVRQRQKTELQPQMLKLMPVIAMSVFGKVPKDLGWKYNPVRALTNEEEADLSQKKSQPVIETYNAGIISQQTALKELKQMSDETGLFSNITDEDIESAETDTIAAGGELGIEPTPGEEGEPKPAGEPKPKPNPQPKKKAAADAAPSPDNFKGDTIEKQVADLMEHRSFSLEAEGDSWAEYSRGDYRYGKNKGRKWEDLSPQERGRWCRVFFDDGEVSHVVIYPSEKKKVGWSGVFSFTQMAGDAAVKMTKAEVNFEHPAKGPDHCGDCKYFQDTGCSLVAGAVRAEDWCEEFHRATSDAATDPNLVRTEADVEGHLVFQGLPINVENLRGSTRHGRTFHQRLTAPYGYIRNTEGADGDAVDCFVGPVNDAPYVYVVHTKKSETDEYDEDKCFLGFASAKDAQAAFYENYSDPRFFESMEKFTVADFKRKLKSLKGRRLTA